MNQISGDNGETQTNSNLHDLVILSGRYLNQPQYYLIPINHVTPEIAKLFERATFFGNPDASEFYSLDRDVIFPHHSKWEKEKKKRLAEAENRTLIVCDSSDDPEVYPKTQKEAQQNLAVFNQACALFYTIEEPKIKKKNEIPIIKPGPLYHFERTCDSMKNFSIRNTYMWENYLPIN